MKRKPLYRYSNTETEGAASTNDAKNQIHLLPGSDEYQEYLEDLQLHDPFHPDDPTHESWEVKNEAYKRKIKEKNDLLFEHPVYDRIYKQGLKDALYEKSYEQAQKIVGVTETTKDDAKLASRSKRARKLIHDLSVTPDSFEEEFNDLCL